MITFSILGEKKALRRKDKIVGRNIYDLICTKDSLVNYIRLSTDIVSSQKRYFRRKINPIRTVGISFVPK